MYTMEYYSAITKNTFESVLMRWMKLEPMIQSEVSQKEKYQYSIPKHIYGFRKMVMTILYVRQQKRHTWKEQSFGLCGRSKGGMIWKNSIETCILSYMKQIASLGLMHETRCSWLVHWDDPEGWDGEGGGRGVQGGEHMYIHGWFVSMYGKTITIL